MVNGPAAPSSWAHHRVTFSVPVTAGSTYLVEELSSPTTSLPFAQVTGSVDLAKHLGSVSIGLNAAAGRGRLLPEPGRLVQRRGDHRGQRHRAG